MQTRREFLKGVAGGAAAAAAAATPMGAALAAAVPENTTPGKADAAAAPASETPRFGWCLYDNEAIHPAHMAAVRTYKPTILRWFLSWDRHHIHPSGGGTGGIAPQPDWLGGPHKEFFKQLLPSPANPLGTTLVVQMQVKSSSWEGDWYPVQNPGTKWARNDRFFGRMYPDRFGIPATYGAFVKTLDTALRSLGVTVIWEAWNEADLRSTVGPLAAENYLDPWYVNPFNLWMGVPYYFWSGGAGPMWHSLYQQLPTAKWASSGLIKPNWIQRTAQFGELNHIDLHYYRLYGQSNAQKYVSEVENLVSKWDNAAPGLPKRKVFIGECGLESLNQNTDVRFAATLYRRHVALSKAHTTVTSPLYGRYVGTIAHNGGVGCKSTWQLPLGDPAAAWWQYKSQYEGYIA